MKKKLAPFVLTIVLLSATQAVAQKTTIPRNQFKVELSTTSLSITPGETKDITIHVYRSKRYSKVPAKLNVASVLPEGISINYEPSDDVWEKSVATLSVSKDAKPGVYFVIPNACLKDKRKGVALKVLVNELPAQAVTLVK